MPDAVRSRLTYANVVATGAMFLALGGGAYALSGVPDRGGVFHGCVSKKTGVLRVVANARSCRGAVSHGKHRDAGEYSVNWNQRGQPGAPGAPGTPGAPGASGAAGVAGSALAYAHVFGKTATLDAANSTNVTEGQVTHGIGEGSFCFNLSFVPKSVVATVDLGSQDTAFATAQLGRSAGNCPAGTTVSVKVTVGGASPKGEDDDFFVVFN
jgi:hypothetical protein